MAEPYIIDESGNITTSAGRLVGTRLEDGVIRYEPGMAGPHKRRLETFLAGPVKDIETPSVELDFAMPASMPTVEPCKKMADELPPFDKTLGVYTPGFREYVESRRLTIEEQSALIRRLEKR